MQLFISHGLVLGVALGLAGCASVDNEVKVPPGSYSSHILFTNVYADPSRPKVTDPIEQKIEWLMPLVEIDAQGFIHPSGINVKDAKSQDKSPVYVAYDISRIEMGQFDALFPGTTNGVAADAATAAQARNILVFRILYLSDKNFDAYTLRLQTGNDAEKLASDSLNTVGTATVGGLSLVAPPAAAGVALAKMVTDSTMSNVQNSFLGGQTVDALFKAMAANRAQYKTQIINRMFGNGQIADYKNYPIFWAMDNIRELNRISTLPGALEDITQKANTQVQAANTAAGEITKNQQSDTPAVLDQKLNSTTADAVNAVK